MSECNHQCGGRCCQDFSIYSHTAEQIGEMYANAMARVIAWEPPINWDVLFIAEMVIRIDEDDEARPRYTCTHFVPETGLCGVYDQRPWMCRSFPNGTRCCYGCGYKNELPELVQISPNPDETKPDERAA